MAGNPLAVYSRCATPRAGYGGFIWTGDRAIASLSPNFLALREGAVMARPMKGTAARQSDAAADAAAQQELAADPSSAPKI